MSKIRVLVVDDSVVTRKLVSDALAADPLVEVVGVAGNGRIALRMLTQVNPDAVILDVEMPGMDGLAALAELRKTHPKLPVIMFSTLTDRGAAATLEALAKGANDYVTKPANAGSLAAAIQHVQDQLLPRIKLFCRGRDGATGLLAARQESSTNRALGTNRTPRKVSVIGIGCSTGGPNALADLLAALPLDLPVPILITQHMPPTFTRLLAEGLTVQTGFPVIETTDDDRLEPGVVYVAPGDHHLTVAPTANGVVVKLNQQPAENGCRPAVDVMFRSLAQTFGAGTLGVVLTGMGKDGLRGAERIVEAGGTVLAQDEATSVVWGMPGFVANAGLARQVLPLLELPDAITKLVTGGRPATALSIGGA
ncbi:protein-glutamate methylesterase/protein-glutamine glutaminase [Limnoglobus roseus]|uniref:Protein-glutamate methylesterase/protein-glutamine glutaminase n=1 Tax=Limnoglobus roseus TaxID=2598579 RepID=A0A5C1A6Z6_9BACT|nr:chemotaxis response regulator protein-glutamate methylesterase [Limnoglobus roseus]QEL13776.1 chemotaxis response regulator protein-glutamate methylesterase [Limnoglobus roseus]